MSENRKHLVLVVDPSRTMRHLIRAEFNPAEFDVMEAASGSAAYDIAATHKPSLVTLGTVLTDGDGAEICRRITESLSGAEAPIIVVTSHDPEHERLLASQYGVVHFIHKGFKPGALAEYVRDIMTPTSALEGRRILVVDDSPLPRECLRRTLGAQGAIIMEAEDGSTALELVASQTFDLVITDQFMSRMNGLEFMQVVRRAMTPDELPIILLSAATCHSLLTAALAGGANDFVRKPFEAVELLARVNNCLRTSALSKRLRNAIGEAEYANRTKSAFFATMSLEMRNPLTAVIGYADQLKDASLTLKERADAITAIGRSGEQLVQLIDEITDYARIETGRMSIDVEEVSPLDILLDTYRRMRTRAEEKGLQLLTEVNGPVPARIQSDPVRLRQILENLVDNAIKFTAKGHVRVTMRFIPANIDGRRAGRSALEFVVEDTGEGIDARKIGAIFDAFSSVAASSQAGGVELGLAISRHCARMLGGNIVATSVRGAGSAFTVTIATGDVTGVAMTAPDVASEIRRRDAAERAAAAASDRQVVSGDVLLADDAVFNQRLLQRMLEKAGLRVTIVENGRDAVDRALAAKQNGTPFDLVLMDMQMPVLDGVDATRELRRRDFSGAIVALTASTSSEDRDACLAAGCNDFLSKPIDKKRLLDVVSHFCAEKTADRPQPCSAPVAT
ncbi:MAG TPA: response regulator [Phycisphaerae bacterium]|nr:response regulator [Phycisphaerae bacterium]HRW55434.1 response regulator [Phycisphaerae bacterium]